MTLPNPRLDTTMAPLDADGQPRRFFGPDLERSRVRGLLESLGLEVQRLEANGVTTEKSTLSLRYDDLAKALAFGPEPEVRTCPTCGTVGMRRASICGNCWTHLTPPA